MSRCNCENSKCPSHNFDALNVRDTFRACENNADPRYRVMYIGEVCKTCFLSMPEQFRLPTVN